ncbi:hypothetical protein KR018_000008, partial [Drosophila ironensis]
MMRHLLKLIDAEGQRKKNQERFEQETAFLDQEILQEEVSQKAKEIPIVTAGEIIKKDNVEKSESPDDEKSTCTLRKGVVTSLCPNSGAIDNFMFFSLREVENLFKDLHVGCKVEYLAYKGDDDAASKIVKITKITEQVWDKPTDAKIQESVESLKKDKPMYFDTQLRNVMGIIKKRLPSGILVDTDYGEKTLELDGVKINFVPSQGDRVCLECKVQLDDAYVDKQGEILEVYKVSPSRLEPNQKGAVTRVFVNFAVIGDLVYVLKRDYPTGCELHLGDVVQMDLMECDYTPYIKRAIKLTLLEKNFGVIKALKGVPCHGGNESTPITVTGPTRYITKEMWVKHRVILTLRNNLARILTIQGVTIRNENSQLTVIEPLEPTEIVNGGEVSVILDIQPKYKGEAEEKFYVDFQRFKITRVFTVIVCETDEEVAAAEKRAVAAESLMAPGRTVAQRSRSYANQVWSNKLEVVPGECIATKRRFVSVRLGYYEVPEKLRRLYLTIERRMEMFDAIEQQYPFIREPLDIGNYIQRFSLFLHLEEIEYFVSFRNYDRDRAHFQRDGEFLSLQIENLAERRPSLVVGDVVRAVNPWVDNGSGDRKSFEGIIHKVLFNRVLLKFNGSFQDKYNGEDYRLEFYFSRFGFRKQHFAIARVAANMGEDFLFPTIVPKKENPQLDVRLENEDLYLYDSPVPWFNKSLNPIQKRAVCNILRGDAENLPYVIFGPPGTGKTVTLVEAITQLVRNLPGVRLLVGTPSNSSADLITKRIIDSQVMQPGEFIRLVSQNQIEKDLIPPELMSYCATVDIGSIGSGSDNMVVTDSGLKLRCQMKFMGRHKVTISTCTTLGNFLQMGFPTGHFTHVLIDEAGQCTEPETMIPITLLVKDRCQTILAGDPNQLQAIVTNRHAGERGFSVSYLERLLNCAPYKKDLQRFPETSGFNPMLLTMLLYNYRALPSIMTIYSRLFYDKQLVPMVDEKDSREARLLAELREVIGDVKDSPTSHGTFFFGITGQNMQEDDSPSWYNASEAREVFLTTVSLYRCNVTADQIGILTPYVKQVKTIRTMFQGTTVAMPKVGSVEEFQGQERDIMLISTVRSTESVLRADYRLSLGFVRCTKRMNVAISRARCLMIIFGNPHLLSVDDCWRHLILFCANNNAYLGCELPSFIENDDDD